MRFLKIGAIFMVALVVLTVAVLGYFYATASVSIAAYKAEGFSAADNAEKFAQIKQSLSDSTFEGTIFRTDELGDAADYAFITYTLRLSNRTLVPIDRIEVQVVPGTDDVVQLGDLTNYSLEARSQGDITATILTVKDSHSIRELIVTYYLWGVSFSLRETYGG